MKTIVPSIAAIILTTVTLPALGIAPAHAAFKDQRIPDHVDKIRITDDGPFQVWNGIDADAPSEGARVLAVIGARKSLRVHYSAAMPAPQVQTGPGWIDVLAGDGAAMTFSSPKSDCYRDTILWCTSGPFSNLPPGTILCMCTRTEGSICCSSDTGIFPKQMVPIEGEL